MNSASPAGKSPAHPPISSSRLCPARPTLRPRPTACSMPCHCRAPKPTVGTLASVLLQSMLWCCPYPLSQGINGRRYFLPAPFSHRHRSPLLVVAHAPSHIAALCSAPRCTEHRHRRGHLVCLRESPLEPVFKLATMVKLPQSRRRSIPYLQRCRAPQSRQATLTSIRTRHFPLWITVARGTSPTTHAPTSTARLTPH
jgi:hypothetical protein